MKTIFKLFMFGLILMGPTMLLAQGFSDDPATPMEMAFATFSTLAVAIPVVVEFLKNVFGVDDNTKSWIVQGLSWITGIAMTLFGWAFNLGFLAEITWQWALIYGFGASLAANGIADTKIIQWIFSLFSKK